MFLIPHNSHLADEHLRLDLLFFINLIQKLIIIFHNPKDTIF